MKKEIQYIKIKEEVSSQIHMISNYSHFYFKGVGIVLTSNKGLKLPKVFINLDDIIFITWF